MNIIYNKQAPEVAIKARKAFTETANEIIGKKGKVLIALPGGRSIVPILQELKKAKITWEKTQIFMIDERLVALEHKESNFRLLREHLLDYLIIQNQLSETNLHPFLIKTTENQGIADYDKELKKYGGKYDIIFLGSGEDGHVAALYPGHWGLTKKENYFVMHDSPKHPKERMTSSVSLLQKADVAFILFFGEQKIRAYKRFNDNKIDMTGCPAKLVNKINKIYILTDLEA